MRRLAATLLVLGASACAVLATGAGGDDDRRRYTVEFDNAFGLVEGGDLKVAGVRAGVIERVRLDRETLRGLADIRVDDNGFGALRADATCEIRPQSLLGEYYVDCLPGESADELPAGARIPVQRTSSTIPPDLITSIMRLPVRQRLRIVIDELGAAAAGNGRNLNAALRRALPALRETDRVLASLADDRRVLRDLVEDADTVIGALDDRRDDVGRWVRESERLATTSALRAGELRRSLRATPRLLSELEPALVSLERLATDGAPAVATLSAAAPALARLLRELPDLAGALRPALREISKAGARAQPALRAARPVAHDLRTAVPDTAETTLNARLILEHLDDRQAAVEADPRSPGGAGFTGLEGLLQFIHTLATLTNAFDGEVHLLKAALSFTSECQQYHDPARVTPELFEKCASVLGPNQPGVTTPDPTKPRAGQKKTGSASLAEAESLLDYLLGR